MKLLFKISKLIKHFEIIVFPFLGNSGHIQKKYFQSGRENVLPIENNDDFSLLSDLDIAGRDPIDLNRPNKRRR